MSGGQGRSFRVGEVVLKPVEPDLRLTQWLAETLAAVEEVGFRVSRPLRTTEGSWTNGGWTASCFVPGTEPDHGSAPRWLDIIVAGRAFHNALAGRPRPGFLDDRCTWWDIGDQVAWGERDADFIPPLDRLHRLLRSLAGPRPPEEPQLVHGDLTGNVLFAPGLAPAVIDLSPYWRPTAFAEAVVVGDAIIWHGAGQPLLRAAASISGPHFAEHVARAVIYRLATTNQRLRCSPGGPSRSLADESDRYDRAARILGAFA
nr:phosphotransferase [Streptomyces sp. 846.5]